MFIIINAVLFLFLVICAVTDIRHKEIYLKVLIPFAIAGLILFIIYRPVSIFEEILGIMTGLVFIGLWAISDGKIGLGDALLMTVTGIFKGGRENAGLIMTAMLMSAVYSIYCLAAKKADRHTKFAFAPFILISFIIMTLCGFIGSKGGIL